MGSGLLAGSGWLAGLSGCGGPELAEVETRQQALEKEVVVLRTTVMEMRTQLQAMGIVPAGPAAGVVVEPGDDLSETLLFQVQRSGTAPEFGPLGTPDRREKTDCGFRFGVPWLEPLSDSALDKSGAGQASPVRLFADGKPLTPHVGPVAYERTCKFGMRHQPTFLFFSTEGTVDNTGATWTMALAPEIPMKKGDDAEAYWVYPGTTVTFTFERGWDPAWGEFSVTLHGRALAVGTPEVPVPAVNGVATASVLGVEAKSVEGALVLEQSPKQPDGSFKLDVSSPTDGPYVLIDRLVIGNGEHALVVTGGESE